MLILLDLRAELANPLLGTIFLFAYVRDRSKIDKKQLFSEADVRTHPPCSVGIRRNCWYINQRLRVLSSGRRLFKHKLIDIETEIHGSTKTFGSKIGGGSRSNFETRALELV